MFKRLRFFYASGTLTGQRLLGCTLLLLSLSHAAQAQQMTHRHGQVDAALFPFTPSVTLTVHQDAMAGWNLQMQTSHFQFRPDRVNTATLPGEGHAHLYINGRKAARLYGPWYHLDPLPPGQYRIEVRLNTHDHSEITVKGQPISSSVNISVPE